MAGKAVGARRARKQAGGAKTSKAEPDISEMVINAVKEMKGQGGSSFRSIKKYIASQYKVDVEKLAPLMKFHLRCAVDSGIIIQTKVNGASGSSASKRPNPSTGSSKSAGGKGSSAATSKGGKKATGPAAGAKSKTAASG